MQFSLLSQFQGVLVGAAIGELLGVSWATQVTQTSPLSSTELQPSWQHPQRSVQHLFASISATSLSIPGARSGRLSGRLVVCGARSLAKRGELDLADWQRDLPVDGEETVDLGSLAGGEMAIASLPIALFFHEDETKLYQHLERVAQWVVPEPSSILASFIISLAIAQALRNQFQSQQVIPQMIAAITRLETRLGRPTAGAEQMAILMQQLVQVQTLVEQQASLEQVRSQLCQPLESTPIPHELKPIQPILAALYCGLSTPNDWQLAVLRSVQMKIAPPLVATLTGALAGAANSLAGIPVDWRLALDQPHSGISALKFLWQAVEWEAELMELATNLLATWSGTYAPQKFPVKRYHIPAIAAPRVIRPR